MTQDTRTMHIDPEDARNLKLLEQYADAFKAVSGVEASAGRRMDALDSQWKYDEEYRTWACLSVVTDPPIEWVEIEVSAEVSVGLATVEQVEAALGFYNMWAFGDLYKLYGDWLDSLAKPRQEWPKVYSDDLRRHWRQENERQERIDKYGRYSDSEVNFFIFCDIANKRVERNTEINWGGHDYPHWDNVKGEDRRQPLLFTTTRGLKLKPEVSLLTAELQKLVKQQRAMMSRFIHLLGNEVNRIKV